jgi:hypothetical protein
MKRIVSLVLFFSIQIFAQEVKSTTNSFFDDSELKEYALKNILVEGEVENPGLVELTSLPLCSIAIKEVVFENNKDKIKGAYFYSGYSLYDIINSKTVKKTNEKDFKPFVDLYVVVSNDKGEKTVFSWGEIYYTKDNFKSMLSKDVRAINPSKMKMKWPLPDDPRIICANDAFNYRFISNPTKITVKSFEGLFSSEKKENMFSPKINLKSEIQSVTIAEIKNIEKRSSTSIGYGHGMGIKGINLVEGYLLKDVIKNNIKLERNDYQNTIVVVSAKDGYRSVFSLSEVMNRSDNEDFLLIDNKDYPESGRFALFATPDFFVDRNVRSIEKIEVILIK